jgi:hypothetical protein
VSSDWLHSTDTWDDDDDNAIEFPGISGGSPSDDNFEDAGIDILGDDLEAATSENDETVDTILVTAANPSGTVAATGFMDGRVFQVELSPQVTRMTESELGSEIVKVCYLASRQAEATQHYLLATLMQELGHDHASTRGFLEHTIGLPTPETVITEKTRMYSEYYSTGDECNPLA